MHCGYLDQHPSLDPWMDSWGFACLVDHLQIRAS
uniref:Unplaced genomic scaffold supercont1.3, whole genome shotgun sequence n=1 Tax=Cryptococcus bacillisporus CA1280 TaxID=1296109 RepID=A0A0D0ULX2_CRYGA|nr:hypothetical protein I312_01341 [Cryptococcus bacillisporus CA1280]